MTRKHRKIIGSVIYLVALIIGLAFFTCRAMRVVTAPAGTWLGFLISARKD